MAGDEGVLQIVAGPGGSLVLGGELDATTAPALDARLTDLAIGAVDLGAVTFIDSAGLRSLVHAHHVRLEAGSSLTLQNPTSAARRLFALTGLTGHLDITP